MAHEYLIKDIAFQAGLSTATVDRVVNGRGGVRKQTLARVEAAILELRQQEANAGFRGLAHTFDMVIQAPDRFVSAVRAAFDAEAHNFQPVSIRTRFHTAEQMEERALVQLLQRIKGRGSHGIVLKAPDTPAIRYAVEGFTEAGIPVVTLVTDLPTTRRLAYAGADNRVAGETAAYLIGSRLDDKPATVLVSLSSSKFRGEGDREIGFRELLRRRYPHIDVVEISEGMGRDSATGDQARALLAAGKAIDAVYSIGGGNRAIVEAFEEAGNDLPLFVAHDLDQDNLALLRNEKLSFVLHHDLRADAASVYRTLLRANRPGSIQPGPVFSPLVIITPFNIPG